MLDLRCSRPVVSISMSISFCPSTIATRSSSCCVALNSMRFILSFSVARRPSLLLQLQHKYRDVRENGVLGGGNCLNVGKFAFKRQCHKRRGCGRLGCRV